MKTLMGILLACIFLAMMTVGPVVTVADDDTETPSSGNQTESNPAGKFPEFAFEVEGSAEPSEQIMDVDSMNNPDMPVMECSTCCELHGDLEGMMERIKYINKYDGSIEPDMEVTFTGMVIDDEGTFTAVEVGEEREMSPDSAFCCVTFQVTGGTGDLEGIQGTLEIQDTNEDGDVVRTYSGILWFEE